MPNAQGPMSRPYDGPFRLKAEPTTDSCDGRRNLQLSGPTKVGPPDCLVATDAHLDGCGRGWRWWGSPAPPRRRRPLTRALGAEDGVGVTGARTRLRITTGELRTKGGLHDA